jgi:hypothetical protein
MNNKTKIPFAPQTVFSDTHEEDKLNPLHQRRVSIASTSSENAAPSIHQYQRRSSLTSTESEMGISPPKRRMTLSAWPVNSGMPLRWWETGMDDNAIHVAMDHVQFGL